MTKLEKMSYMENDTIGYWSALGGIEVKHITWDAEAYAIVVANAWSGKRSVHRCKIYNDINGAYIKLNGRVYRFDECLRA